MKRIMDRVKRCAANLLYAGAEVIDGLTTVVTLGLYEADYVASAAWEQIQKWHPDPPWHKDRV